MAAVNAIDAMVHIGRSRRAISPQGEILDDKARSRLEMLGELVAREAWRWRDTARQSKRQEAEVGAF